VIDALNVLTGMSKIMLPILKYVLQDEEMDLRQELKNVMMVTQQPLMDAQLIDLQLRQAGFE
jgi:hypothetical protein